MQSKQDERERQETKQTLLESFLESGAVDQVRELLSHVAPERIAALLETIPIDRRRVVWNLLNLEREAEVLKYLQDESRKDLVKGMEAEELLELTKGMETDEVANILQKLPEAVMEEVLTAMTLQDRARVERVLHYEEDTAGALMNTDTVTVPPYFTCDAVLRYLRQRKSTPKIFNQIFVADPSGKFLGVVSIGKVLCSNPHMTMRELMDDRVSPIPVAASVDAVIDLFDRMDWVSAPVVSEEDTLLGHITVDDVLQEQGERAERTVLGRVGLGSQAEDVFTPLLRAAPKRLLWLGINLVTAFIAAGTIRIFEGVLDQVVALAVLMPIVASMGGISGMQILTLMERGFARGQISMKNLLWFLNREWWLGCINGLVWALVVGVLSWVWFGDSTLGLLIGIAMVFNILVAVFTGVLLPSFLRSIKIDTVVAGSVVLTTITDVCGFFSFLGLATWAYL